jgi:broad specificity phosphatase PhoE
MKLYLIRHGQQKQNWGDDPAMDMPDPELSTLGCQQAELLAYRLAEKNISAIYTSDLKRAVQTAEIVNHHLGLTIQQEPDLREIDMGEVPRKGWNQIAIEFPSFYQQFQAHSSDIAYPGGESGFDVQLRVLPVIQEIVASNPVESNLAIVCHGGVIMVLLAAILEMPQERRFRFRIDHCSISILEYDSIQRSFQILSVNDAAHLAEKHKEKK